MPSDLEIAQAAKLKPITEIAAELGLAEEDLHLYGRYVAKVSLDVLEKFKDRPDARYIDVTCITPTPLGEGKSVTMVGLSQALNRIGHKTFACIRQPSMGPTFGIKGGAAGGGYSQVVPMEDFNLHLTGDIHAVGVAHNLLATAIDARMMHEANYSDRVWARRGLPRLNIDPYTITWNRVVDLEDQALRNIVIGLGEKMDGRPRRTGFDITVSSEVMALLGLTTGLKDMRERLGRITVATDRQGSPITAEDLGVAGAMAVLLKDAIEPNLMQTLENTPAFCHTGPFANIAHGNSSALADMIASKLCDYVVTESGFGADIGMEKFMDIKCRVSGMTPDCVVMVVSIRSLKMHGGLGPVRPGRPLPKELTEENLEALEKGCANLQAQIENALAFGVPVVVAVNRFTTDSEAEIELVKEKALEYGAEGAYLSDVWAKGGAGGVELAEAVVEACEKESHFQFLYPLDWPIKKKIETIATRMYRAGRVEYSPQAETQIERYTRFGFDNLPINMAKTHLSLSHDPNLKGAPKGFALPIREVRASVGAGFLYPLCGEMRTMPGLPSRPAFMDMDLDEQGRVVGLF